MPDIEDMINNITNQDFSKSKTYFDAVMADKVSDSLEQEKIRMANKIFNLGKEEEEQDEDEDEDDDFSDEEYDEAAENALDDDDDDEET